VIGLAAAVVAFLLARQRVLARRQRGPTTVPVAVDWRSVLWVCAGLAGYLAAISPGGFVVASTILFSSVAVAFGSRRRTRDAAIGLLVSGAVFVVFTRGLGLHLPEGVLGAWTR
jgi:putative tricarboxylic transport membrane protein